MREIVFDTETTGLDCLTGDRLIEIGCVELLNHIPTGRTFHGYVNPRRPVAYEASLVHGLTDEFLRGQPGFEEVVEAFCEFVGDSMLVAHNAGFDRGFINMELGLCGRAPFEEHRFVDTLVLARRRHPNGAEQPRRALRPLRHRHQRAHQARRAARRRDPGRGLSRAARRPAGEPVARRRCAGRAPAAASDRRGQDAPAPAAAAPDGRRTTDAHRGLPRRPRRRRRCGAATGRRSRRSPS